ncbi:FecR domain-containing protein [Verrucomicrobiaceae bacterium N1E253]|uniref:FecR domain-containing protein n=1 Tax=Oceaniferula marina TaxID=2748318 RepID=A0A851GCW5_9BACT|nr:FecR domain-containing protein [Oceaniferula marina]NWK55588.1 FecR domain-containing protein [Oceaniferula marina]
MKSKKEWEIAELFERVVDGRASEQEVSDLEQHLMTDSEALTLYQDLARQHSQLQMTDGIGLDAKFSDPSKVTPRFRGRFFVAAAAAALLLFGMMWMQLRSLENRESDPVVAELTAASSAKWGACSLPTTPGGDLTRGQLELLQGTATLTFSSGAVVSLEAPVKMDLLTGMKALLHYGTAVADVPEQAVGFRLDTPDCEVTDLGTSFAVSVDKESREARIDVLDGEVELYHGSSDHRKRVLKNQSVDINQDGVSAGRGSLEEFGRVSRSGPAFKAGVITTERGAGGHATVISDHKDTHLSPGLLLVKHSKDGRYARKSYLKFDLRHQEVDQIKKLTLVLNQVQSPYGLASFVPDCEFVVYGLLDGERDLWDAGTMGWLDAPANQADSPWKVQSDQVVELGSFVIPKGQQQGMIRFTSERMGEWARADGNGLLSLIIVRKTCELRGEGLVHAFAGNHYPEGQAPRLLIELE